MNAEGSPTGSRPLDLPAPDDARVLGLARLIAIVDRLRDPDGCPWDRAQTLETLAPHLVEEAGELLEAIEADEECAVVEEAGDLLMGIVLIARVAHEARRFDLARVAEQVSDKLIRRHPHVFAGERAGDAHEALSNWEAVKRAERRGKDARSSALDGVPRTLPALQRAKRIGDKAIAAGFRWTDARGARAKVVEELGELEDALDGFAADATAGVPEGEVRERIEHELGDLLLAGALLGCYVGIDPERAARRALRRFEARFRTLESELDGRLEGRPLSELVAAWERAKVRLAADPTRGV